MSSPAPEFSRPVRIDQIARHAQGVTIAADASEREALARRFNLLALDRLEADYAMSEENGAIVARGRVRAELAQPCVATGVAVPEKIDTDFLLRFVAESVEAAEGEELEIDSEDCDVIGFDGQMIDMGEAVAETVVLLARCRNLSSRGRCAERGAGEPLCRPAVAQGQEALS
jgi:uncharacterized metal-binding protein YceD (DUF177 family)